MSAVHRGSLEPPHTKHSWVRGHYHPEGAARCLPIVPLPPLRNSSPLRNEGASHRERGALTATSSCPHWLVLPHFYPVFTLFLPRSAPSFLFPFYPVFTPWPVFTLSTVLPPFLPQGQNDPFLLVFSTNLDRVRTPKVRTNKFDRLYLPRQISRQYVHKV